MLPKTPQPGPQLSHVHAQAERGPSHPPAAEADLRVNLLNAPIVQTTASAASQQTFHAQLISKTPLLELQQAAERAQRSVKQFELLQCHADETHSAEAGLFKHPQSGIKGPLTLYHGTTLACSTLLHSGQLCNKECGVCSNIRDRHRLQASQDSAAAFYTDDIGIALKYAMLGARPQGGRCAILVASVQPGETFERNDPADHSKPVGAHTVVRPLYREYLLFHPHSLLIEQIMIFDVAEAGAGAGMAIPGRGHTQGNYGAPPPLPPPHNF